MNTIPNDLNPLGKEAEPVVPEQPDLPAGYTRLAFLGTTGTQYVDTGLAFGSETLLSVDVSVIEGSYYNTNAAILAGSIKNMNTAGLTITIGKSSHGIGLFWDGQGIASSRVFVEFGANRIPASNSANCLIVNGVTDKTWEYESWNSRSGDRLWICAPNSSVTVYPKFAPQNARFYAAAVSNDGTPQADYIPAINPFGESGMFDKITQTFFTNDGDGVFVAGIETMYELFSLSANLIAVAGADTNTTIPLSLPGEFENDSEAQSYLIKIMAKGWTPNITYRS